MSQQPEAIRLAAVCDLGHPLEDDVALIGPELLRLHAVESGAKVELMRRDNLIDSLHGLCESYRTQVERLEADPRIGKCQACGHECEACHLQNASQTPQTDLSLMAAPQEWSPAYTRGPARQSAPVAASARRWATVRTVGRCTAKIHGGAGWEYRNTNTAEPRTTATPSTRRL